jgi:N-acetylneuraminate synthase/N,N'-diacetyllegionaminate synthase
MDAPHPIPIGRHTIFRDSPPFILAEIGVNHDGSPALAEQFIRAAHAAGAHGVKFQLFDAKLLLASGAGLVDYQKSSAGSAEDLLEPLQLSPAQMAPLIQQAQSLNLAAIVTPFSPDLVAPCLAMGVDAIKIASPDLVNRPLIEEAIKTNLPLILSTGAAELAEIHRTVTWVQDAAALSRTVLLHCVSSYPTPPESATLGAITALRNEFPTLAVGYSDHTTETLTGALAVCAGACFLEKHFTLDKTRRGPDHAASLEPAAFAEYAALARNGYSMRGPIAKAPQPLELQIRQQTRQSVVTRTALKSGTTLTRQMLTIKRPGTGIPAAELAAILGQRLARDVSANTVLTRDDLIAAQG